MGYRCNYFRQWISCKLIFHCIAKQLRSSNNFTKRALNCLDWFPCVPVQQLLYFYPTCQKEVSNTILKFKNNKYINSPRFEEVSPIIVKYISFLISPVPAHIINPSKENGVRPSQLNRAEVLSILHTRLIRIRK